MNTSPKYVIDTCSFTALRRLYPGDVFPGVWQAITKLAATGILISSTEVLIELEAQEDIITDWARNHKDVFLPLTKGIQQTAIEILSQYPNLLDLNNLKSNADPFVIATAKNLSCTLVTEEIATGNGAKRVKIPNICYALGIPCIQLLDLLREEQIRFDIKQ